MKYMIKYAVTIEELRQKNKAKEGLRIRRPIRRVGFGIGIGGSGKKVGPMAVQLSKGSKVFMEGDFSKMLNRWELGGAAKSGRSKEMVNRITFAHEADEIRAGNRAIKQTGDLGQPWSGGHRSSDVILREHNNVTTLKGAKKDIRGVKKDFRMMRTLDKSQAKIQQAFPQLNYKHGKSQRLSRHAIKRMQAILDQRSIDARAKAQANRATSRLKPKRLVSDSKQKFKVKGRQSPLGKGTYKPSLAGLVAKAKKAFRLVNKLR